MRNLWSKEKTKAKEKEQIAAFRLYYVTLMTPATLLCKAAGVNSDIQLTFTSLRKLCLHLAAQLPFGIHNIPVNLRN